MKTRLLILLLCLSSLSVMGQGIITRNKPKQEQAAQKKETPAKKETRQQRAAPKKKETSKPVAKEEPKKPAQKKSKATASPTTGTANGHEWVDLGLPSGTKWATTNVGATSPSDYGNYYAWGETSTKSTYTRGNYKYSLGSNGDEFSKYVTDSEYGQVDNKYELDLTDDAAYVNWGQRWRTPSPEQMDELCEECNWTWTTMGGHKGYKVVGPNGNSIFLPAAGNRREDSLYDAGTDGFYQSSMFNIADTIDGMVIYLYFRPDDVFSYISGRSVGQSVRPVLAL